MTESFWRIFCDTGDPISYLMCKAGESRAENGEKNKDEKRPASDTPDNSLSM